MDKPIERFLLEKTYESTRQNVEEALTLPPETYRLPELHQLENERVFGNSWVAVGYTCQLKTVGQMIVTNVAGQPIVITKDEEGCLRAFYNVCRHRGSLLVLENGVNKRFRCPYHSWTYDLKGELQHCPLFEEANKPNFNKEDYKLLPIRVASWGAIIFVCLNNNTEPLSDYLGDMPEAYREFPFDEMLLVRRKKYEINANWKLVAENFLEYYHLPWVHPELCEVAAIDMHQRNQGAGMYMSFYASPLQKGNTPLDADFLPSMPKLNPRQKISGYFPLVFPNLAAFLLPHHFFVLLMNPLSIDKTEEYADLLVHPNILNEANHEQKIDEIFAFYDLVNNQDIIAVQRVQDGLRAKAYPGGRMSFRFEEPVHRFQNMWIDFMTGQRRKYAGDSIETTNKPPSPRAAIL